MPIFNHAPGMTLAQAARTNRIFLYFTPLTLPGYLVLPHGYFLDIATTYMLKDRLHASASLVSLFRLLTAAPVYASIVFGLTRDLWNPLGLRDRGYFHAGRRRLPDFVPRRGCSGRINLYEQPGT